ncbi:MAG: hypothetical protein ACFB21_01840 [Opitutales bacterium]
MSRQQPRKKRQPAEAGAFGQVTLGNILNWLTVIALAFIVAFQINQLGAARPETQYLSFVLTCLLLPLHGLSTFFFLREGNYVFEAGILILYGLSAGAFLLLQLAVPGNPVAEGATFLALLQGGIFLYLICHSARIRSQQVALLTVVPVMGVLSLFPSIQQFFRERPELPGLISIANPGQHRVGLPEEFIGQAVGSLAYPGAAALFFSIAAILCLTFALGKRGGASAMVMLYVLGFSFLLGALLTVHPFAWMVLPFLCPVLPLMAGAPARTGLYYGGALVVFFALTFYLTPVFAPEMRAELAEHLAGKAETTRETLAAGAWDVHQLSPVTGVGAGGFDVAFERTRPRDFWQHAETPPSDFGLILAERGLAGLGIVGLFFGVILALLVIGFLSLPARVELDDNEAPRRGSRARSVSSLRRAALGAILACLCPIAIGFWFLRLSATPAIFSLFLIFVGIGWVLRPWMSFRLPRVNAVVAMLVFFGSSLVAALLAVLPFGGVSGLVYDDEASRFFDPLWSAPISDERGFDQRLLAAEASTLRAEAALGQYPQAQQRLARIELVRGYRNLGQADEHGEAAAALLARVVEAQPNNSIAFTELGLANWMRGRFPEAGDAFARATELAPNSLSAWYHYAAWLNEFSSNRALVNEALLRAEQLGGELEGLARLRRKINLPQSLRAQRVRGRTFPEPLLPLPSALPTAGGLRPYLDIEDLIEGIVEAPAETETERR